MDSLEDETMSRKPLTNYRTVFAWNEARHLGGSRHKHEASTIATILYRIISSLSFIHAKDEPAVELGIRGPFSELMAEITGNWSAVR